ncbi:MAG: hypothetical protein IJY20_05275, partial [Clostridia bacterium]|nr:hypothetical protein [Clostridia bacterium]
MQQDMTYTFDEVYHIEIPEGLPETKTALTQVEFEVASVRARGGHLIKFVHDESLGKSVVRLRGEIRRLLRVFKKEGRIILMIPGEKFSMSDGVTRYLADKCPQIELDIDMDKKNEFIHSVIQRSGTRFKLGLVTFAYGQSYVAPLSNDTTNLYT